MPLFPFLSPLCISYLYITCACRLLNGTRIITIAKLPKESNLSHHHIKSIEAAAATQSINMSYTTFLHACYACNSLPGMSRLARASQPSDCCVLCFMPPPIRARLLHVVHVMPIPDKRAAHGTCDMWDFAVGQARQMFLAWMKISAHPFSPCACDVLSERAIEPLRFRVHERKKKVLIGFWDNGNGQVIQSELLRKRQEWDINSARHAYHPS